MMEELLTTFALLIISLGLRAQFTISGTSTCFDYCTGSAVVNPEFGYKYKWSNGDTLGYTSTKLCGGLYYCTVSDSLGRPMDTLHVIIDSFPRLYLSAVATKTSCFGAHDGSIKITASGGDGNYTYLLNFNCSNPSCHTGLFTALPAYQYWRVQVWDSNCGVGDIIAVGQSNTPCVGVPGITELLRFSLFPNPAGNLLTITYELNELTPLHLSIYDMSGRKVMEVLNETQNAGEHKHSVNVKELAAGCYVLNVTSVEGSFNELFVKE